MNIEKLEGYEEACEAVAANMSPRSKRLEWLERWVEGTQYKGRPNWWAPNPEDTPLWEREPCIVYPVVRLAIASNRDLCLGEGRFPSIGIDDGTKRNPGELTPAEELIKELDRLAHSKAAYREAFEMAQGTGTVVAVLGFRDGMPFTEIKPAKWCERDVSSDGSVTRLVIRYPYLEEYKRADGKWAVRAMLYRREITSETDITYLPAPARKDGIEPSWTPDPKQTLTHGLGFCPVVWYAFDRGCQSVNTIDGRAIHQWITDEIQSHDIARSQWHRGALLSEPQPYEIGVAAGYNPTDASGRTPVIPATEFGGPSDAVRNPITGEFRAIGTGAPQSARKKGPGHVWQYPAGVEVGTLVYPGDALQAQRDNCSDLRIKIQESLAVVFLDPENIKFAATTSGKALEAIRQKQLDRCDSYREDFAQWFIIPCTIMRLRMAKMLGRGLRPTRLIELAAKVPSELSRADVEVKWGSYFKADPEEQAKILGLVREAVGTKAPLATLKLALEKLKESAVFNIPDIDTLLQELEDEREEQAERELTLITRMNEGGAVQSDPASVPPGGNRRRPKNGKNDAQSAG